MKKVLEIEKKDLFDRLIKANCKFKKKNNLYYINCNNKYFIAQMKTFKIVEVFEINKKEKDFFKFCASLFSDAVFEILKDKNEN